MCLVVCNDQGLDKLGAIRRIDYFNGGVVRVSDTLGFGECPRFSPDGERIAYIKGKTVSICSSDEGVILEQFEVACNGNISYTRQGISLGAEGGIYRYTTSGRCVEKKECNYCPLTNEFVSTNGKTAAGVAHVDGTWRIIIHDLESGESKVVDTEQGCSACPSPDGTMVTQNMGRPCHTQMRIRTRSGRAVYHLSLTDITGYSPKDSTGRWCWNRQMWSGNSNAWIVLPVGQDTHRQGCCQLRKNCSPWVYRLGDSKGIQLAKRERDFWQPFDFYTGTCISPPESDLFLYPTYVSVRTDRATLSKTNVTITAKTWTGSFENLRVENQPGWLELNTQNISDNVVKLRHSFKRESLGSDTAMTCTLSVIDTNAGGQRYPVTLHISSTDSELLDKSEQ